MIVALVLLAVLAGAGWSLVAALVVGRGIALADAEQARAELAAARADRPAGWWRR